MQDIAMAHFILFVRDQDASSKYYSRVLDGPPTLQVPGMTEFEIEAGTVLGLMPEPATGAHWPPGRRN